ncbi:hypothetical protein ACHAWF_001044 [Thalassiosira exigua]
MHSLLPLCAAAALLAQTLTVSSFAPPSTPSPTSTSPSVGIQPTLRQSTRRHIFGSSKVVPESERSDAESKQATYALQGGEFGLGPAAIVRPLLKQTQLEKRKLQVVYDAKRDGWNARAFHSKVDGKGASVVLAKVRGQWIGGYNPRGWASLGGSRSSVASFLFYQKLFWIGGWQKLRVARTGSMACGTQYYRTPTCAVA